VLRGGGGGRGVGPKKKSPKPPKPPKSNPGWPRVVFKRCVDIKRRTRRSLDRRHLDSNIFLRKPILS